MVSELTESDFRKKHRCNGVVVIFTVFSVLPSAKCLKKP